MKERDVRYLIGIDLGTTNSAVAYSEVASDAPGESPRIQIFQIPQLVARAEVAPHTTLPSFLYFPTSAEQAVGSVRLPWSPAPDWVAGVFAREQGVLVPTRQVASAKSWLAQPAVDRAAPILPWGVENPERLVSPVDASARYLAHLRDAWNHVMAADDPDRRFERQGIVLTVPASFDEEARELTVEAARAAGLERLTLLEEPTAALYAWIASRRGGRGRIWPLKKSTRARAEAPVLILICDVGGGTTDFSLIRAAIEDGELRFERTAIGEHLLLGGDNLDLALAVRAEKKLEPAKLMLMQRSSLRRQCSAAKERLLGDPEAGPVRLTVLGGGRALVGGAASTELTREEVVEALSEFVPITPPGELPASDRRVGLRELGLPYEPDPAITRHLAAFLTRACAPSTASSRGMARPDAIMFNGGFFAAAAARERVIETLSAWFRDDRGPGGRWRPIVLENPRPEAAVAIGAAFYAHLKRSPDGARLLIRAGSARNYYVGIEVGDSREDGRILAICVMPRGTDEGTRLELAERDFEVMTNQPVSFTLYSSPTRRDPLGALVALAEDDVQRHAPLVTVFRFGKKSRRVEIKVGLTICFTEVGTLELWCDSRTTDHRWRLQFDLRAVESADRPMIEAGHEDRIGAPAGDRAIVSDEMLAAATLMLRDAFTVDPGEPETLVARLEAAFGYGKQAWSVPVIRRMADLLLEVADGRRKGPRFEARWLNLLGFCLRPGFGAASDEWRIGEARKIYVADLIFPNDVQCQVEWLVLWQRVNAGFSAGQQRELSNRVFRTIGAAQRKPSKRVNPQIEREGWRLLGTLEQLDPSVRVKFGDQLVERIRREPRNPSFLWALGRLGARQPLYGPLNAVVPPADASRWMGRLLALKELTPDAAWAVAQLGARTDDPVRDIGEELRDRATARLEAAGAAGDLVAVLREYIPRPALESERFFGESLPEGLRLVE